MVIDRQYQWEVAGDVSWVYSHLYWYSNMTCALTINMEFSIDWVKIPKQRGSQTDGILKGYSTIAERIEEGPEGNKTQGLNICHINNPLSLVVTNIHVCKFLPLYRENRAKQKHDFSMMKCVMI